MNPTKPTTTTHKTDFVRFLKTQWSGLGAEERFDRAWMIARRIAADQGISDEDIAAEIAKIRSQQ